MKVKEYHRLPSVKAGKDCAAVDYSKVKVKKSGFLVEYAAGAYPCFNDVKPLRSCHSPWTGRQSCPRAPPKPDGWYSFAAKSTEAMRS